LGIDELFREFSFVTRYNFDVKYYRIIWC